LINVNKTPKTMSH